MGSKTNSKSQPKTWRKVKLGEIMTTARVNFEKVKTSEYKRTGRLPIFDQGSDAIAGYTNNPKAEYRGKSPAILFGDHTLKLKIAEPPFAIGADGIQILEPNEDLLDRNFFYYALKGLKVRSYGYERHMKYLRELEIACPNITDQKRIADILSAFDDKIELNNKISRTLEQMAQAIFKEWFASSSVALAKEGELPKDWEAVDAEKILIFEKGVEPGSNSYSITKKANFIPFYRVRDLEGKNGDTDVFINKEVANNKICKYNDVLISFDATVGRIKIGCSGAFSSGIRRVYSKDGFIKNSFIYFWLKTPYVQNTILEYSSGTTILHAGSSIEFLKILFNKEIINKFQKTSEPIFNKILEIENENQKLASLRDLLLPKLMNGEVRV